ncbi:MAG TPA: immunoglobulin domain-containing protein [Opitutaceae bacterium]|nr:immunoglobulin domain-containing protein [Opitutaceae bacterium]
MSIHRIWFAFDLPGTPALLLGLLPALALGQTNYTPYTFTALAGAASPGAADGSRSRARFSAPGGLAIDSAGNLYVADTGNSTIRKITPDGVVTTLGGTAGTEGSADGIGSAARFNRPAAVAADAAGTIYVADTGNHTIRKIAPDGTVSTVAGSAGNPGSADGTGTEARFNGPEGVAVDASGNVYVADTGNHTLRRFAPGGEVSTVAGSAGSFGDADGVGSAARFNQPAGLTVDPGGTIYVGQWHSGSIGGIRKVTPGGQVTTLALTGPAPVGIAVDRSGNVFAVIRDYCRIQLITPTGVIVDLAGWTGGNLDGIGRGALFRSPRGIAVDPAGTIYVADSLNHAIRMGVPFDPSNNVLWAAGNNTSGQLGDGSTTDRAAPVAIVGGVLAAAGGESHSLVWTADGTIWATGANLYGQLGDGTTVSRDVLAPVTTYAYGRGVAAGANHSLILRYEAWLTGMGRNHDGQLGDGTTTDSASPVPVNRTSDPYFNIQAVTAGADHTLFLASDGTLWGMGYNGYGQLGVATGSIVSRPVRIASGVRAFSAGGEHSLFVKDDGTLWGMGYNRMGQLGDGTAADRATPVPIASDVWLVAAGYHHSLFVKTDGTLWGMGESASGELGGMYGDVVTPVPIASGVRAISAGQNHSLFVKTDATLWAMGDNHYGQLGDTTTVARITPVQIADHVRTIAAGSYHSFFVVDRSLDGSLPAITAQPSNQTVTIGQNATFSVAFDSNSPAVCRWQRRTGNSAAWVDLRDDAIANGTIDGSTAPRITINTASAADGASFRCVITNSNGLAITGSATLTVMAGTPLTVTTLAGRAGISGSADGTGTAARFAAPADLAVDGAGNVYVADTDNHTIRKVAPGGVVTTLAGSAGLNGGSDGTGSAARFSHPAGVAVDAVGNVFVADTDNDTIRKVSPTGVVTTLAGQAGSAGSADGPDAMARFNGPSGLVVDAAGNLYVADTLNNAIRRITLAGTVATVYPPFHLTGGPWLAGPQGLALDGAGNLYIADANSSRIQKLVLATATLTAAVGSGSIGSDDGPAAVAQFAYPSGVAVDGAGNCYVADTDNHTIRQITPAGTVSTIAGLASASGTADGVGAAARFTYPTGIAVDASGNLYVADTNNHTIRVAFIPAAPAITAQPQSESVPAGANVQFSVTTSGRPAPAYQWHFNGTDIAGATSSTLSLPNAQPANAGTYTVTVANFSGSVTSSAATLTVSVAPGGPTGGSASSGGGAMGVWFVVTLVLLLAARRKTRRHVNH